MFKKIIFTLFCALALTTCFANETLLQDTQGNTTAVSKTKKKWIILAYWAGWCGNCQREIPELNRFYQATYKNKNILLFGVNSDGLTGNDLKEAIQKIGIRFPVLAEDPKDIWQLGEVEALPTIFIVNPKGEAVKKLVGGYSAKSLLATLQSLQHE